MTAQWIVLNERDRFRVAEVGVQELAFHEVPVSAGDRPEDIASAIAEVLDAKGYQGDGLALAISSESCLAATITHQGRSMARDARAMAYALEEYLPLAAEETVADFVVFAEQALGVAVEVAAVQPLVTSLEQAGLPVRSIAPLPLLAVQEAMAAAEPQEALVVLWQSNETVDLFDMFDGRPRLWRTVPAEHKTVCREIQLLGLAHGQELRIRAYSLDGPLRDAVRSIPDVHRLKTESLSMDQAGATTAARQLRGELQPWIELSRGSLGSRDPYRAIRGGLRALSLATIWLLVVLSATLLVRAQRQQQAVRACQQQQREVFQRALPGRPVPIGILSRLESEHQQLAGVTEKTDTIPERSSALTLLHDVLLSLLTDLRYRVLEVRLESGRVYVEGEARRHGDADLVAAGLRNAGFHVDPPHTQQLDAKGVAWQIAARLQPGAGADKKKAGTEEEKAKELP